MTQNERTGIWSDADTPTRAYESAVRARWELDGHLWRLEGREDVQRPEDVQWAREVWTCERCGEISKVFNNPPKVWDVRPVRLRIGKDEWLDTDRHVARQCPDAPRKRWWKR